MPRIPGRTKRCVVCRKSFRPDYFSVVTCSGECFQARQRQRNKANGALLRLKRKGWDKKQLELQAGRCWWCGKRLRKYHIDHRVPLAHGGTNDPANLVLACSNCNQRKRSKMP